MKKLVVIGAGEGDLELSRQHGLQKRNVLKKQLLLQVLGSSGNDDAASAGNGWNQVSQCFARAGSGFDQQMTFRGQRVGDCFGHGNLAWTVFVIWVAFRKKTFASEDFFHCLLTHILSLEPQCSIHATDSR